jgi:hypothetical protein
VACSLVVGSSAAHAYEVNGGVSLGVLLAGSVPHLAVSPHVGAVLRTKGGLLFGVGNFLSILPATNDDGVGVYDQTTLFCGIGSESMSITLGPSVSFYSVAASGNGHHGRVSGSAPGGALEALVYFTGPFGVLVRGNVDWLSGDSLVLHDVVAATLIAGPVFRWRSG